MRVLKNLLERGFPQIARRWSQMSHRKICVYLRWIPACRQAGANICVKKSFFSNLNIK
jgi:hypothetical protein